MEGGNAFFTGVLVSATFLADKAKHQGIHPCPGYQNPLLPLCTAQAGNNRFSPELLGKKAGSFGTKVTIITNGIE